MATGTGPAWLRDIVNDDDLVVAARPQSPLQATGLWIAIALLLSSAVVAHSRASCSNPVARCDRGRGASTLASFELRLRELERLLVREVMQVEMVKEELEAARAKQRTRVSSTSPVVRALHRYRRNAIPAG
jgi:hypothetical protein